MNLTSLHRYFFSNPEGKWIMRPDHAVKLFKLVRKEKPKKILDLGTGIGFSASVIAIALEAEKITDYEIHTVEQYEKCYNLAQKLIPEELRKNMKFYLADVEVWTTDKIPYQCFSVFEKLPENDYDLILVDGPAMFMEDDKFIDLPNGDVIKLLVESKIKPGTLVCYDGRITALKVLDNYFSKNFYILDPDWVNFNILEKKDCPLVIGDDKLEAMKARGYFEDPLVKSE